MASEANRDVKFCDHVWVTYSNGDATPKAGEIHHYWGENEQTLCLRCGAERTK